MRQLSGINPEESRAPDINANNGASASAEQVNRHKKGTEAPFFYSAAKAAAPMAITYGTAI